MVGSSAGISCPLVEWLPPRIKESQAIYSSPPWCTPAQSAATRNSSAPKASTAHPVFLPNCPAGLLLAHPTLFSFIDCFPVVSGFALRQKSANDRPLFHVLHLHALPLLILEFPPFCFNAAVNTAIHVSTKALRFVPMCLPPTHVYGI